MFIITDILLTLLTTLVGILIKEFLKHKKQSILAKEKTAERLTAVEVKIDMLLDKQNKK